MMIYTIGAFLFSMSMQGMMSPGPELPIKRQEFWKTIASALEVALTEGARKTHILTEDQAIQVAKNIKAAVRKPAAGGSNEKLIVLLVHKGDENFAKSLVGDFSKTINAFKLMAIELAAERFGTASELSSSLSILPGQSEIDLISYAYGQGDEKDLVKLLDLFIHTLETLNQNKKLKIAIVAAGESAHIVNLMSRESKRNPLDSLIYFQSPIYEWKLGLKGDFYYDEQMSPANFVHLYHIYTKGAQQVLDYKKYFYTERKYKQQARVENGKLISRVKNIRALKVDQAGQLVDLSFDDFFAENTIKQYAKLFEQADNYNVNSDLITKLDQEGAAPSIAINRFVRLNGNEIEQPRAASLIGSEYFYPVINVSSLSLPSLRRAFSLEVEESTGQLINITSLPTPEGWYLITKLVGSVGYDIARIKEQHIKVLSSPLYEFRTVAQAEQFSYIVSDRVAKAIQEIARETGLSASFIEGQMKLGAYYMSLLLNNQQATIPKASQEEYLRSVIALIWFFYSQAIDNKQLFEEGTFVIEDLDWRLNSFLMNYVQTFGGTVSGFKKQKQIEQPLTQTVADPDLNMSFNGFGYPRESSHFKVSQEKFRHYGIDIRFGASSELPLLPAGKRHLLFGKIDDARHLLFIKPENYGLYYKDGFIYHGKEFVESKLRKLGFTAKSDDDASYAKERIPAAFLKEFKLALEVSDLPEEQKNQIFALAQKDNWGIKILYFDSLLEKPGIAALEKKYSLLYNHLNLRTGREVILTNQDLRNALRINKQESAPSQKVVALGLKKTPAAPRTKAA